MFSDLDPASYYLDSKYQFQCILMEYWLLSIENG